MSNESEKKYRPYPENCIIKEKLKRGDLKKISKNLINPQNGRNYNESYIGLVLNGYRYNKLILDYASKIVEANQLADKSISEYESENKFINKL